MNQQRAHTPRGTMGLVATVAMVFATGFAPFNGGGLADFRVLDSQLDPNDQEGASAEWRHVETDALFQTLSSRYGGGGVLTYMEFLPTDGVAGVLILDLRHAGLSDLTSSEFTVPNTRRADLHYQEWRGNTDVFVGERVDGTVEVVDLYRGQGISAVAVRFDLVFYDAGDKWRRIVGTVTTSPTVEQALERDGDGLYRQNTTGPNSDGDIIVDCFGTTTVEETEYDEDSYVVADQGSSCEGDTWEDDAENPNETSGCAGKREVDGGEPDPNGGCDSSGPDVATPTDPDPANDTTEGDTYSDQSGCDEGTSDGGGSNEDFDCSGDSAQAATLPLAEVTYLRRYLDRVERGDRVIGRRSSPGRFSRATWHTMHQILSYLPFMILGLVLHLLRRRLSGSDTPARFS